MQMNLKDKYKKVKELNDETFNEEFKKKAKILNQELLLVSNEKYDVKVANIGDSETPNGICLIDKSPTVQNASLFPILDKDLSKFLDLCKRLIEVQ